MGGETKELRALEAPANEVRSQLANVGIFCRH